MATKPLTTGLIVAGLMSSSAASAQEVACPAGDVDCRGAKAIMRALNETSRLQAVREFAIGEACNDDALRARGRAAYEASIASVIERAKEAVRNDLRTEQAGAVDRVLASTSFAVRAARNAQASGMVSGLESAFTLYPRSRIEYCTRVAAQLKSQSGK